MQTREDATRSPLLLATAHHLRSTWHPQVPDNDGRHARRPASGEWASAAQRSWVLCFLLALHMLPGAAQTRAGLAFREDWKESPPATPVTQDHVSHPDLLVSLHGPGGPLVKKSHHDTPLDDPYYVWSGDTVAPWAVPLRHRAGPIDLSGQARIRWRAKQSGFHELRLVLQLATTKEWLAADHADGPSSD